MIRRDFLTLLGGAAATHLSTWPLAAHAQQGRGTRRVGVLLAGTLEGDGETEARLKAFRERLAQLGWIEGRNLALVVRAFSGEGEQIRAYARELAGLSLDVILVISNPVLAAMRQAAPATPIVFVQVGDPVGSGFVSSLAHPGGNITGVSLDAGVEVWGKRLELLTEAVPRLSKVLFVSTQEGWDGPGGGATREAAQRLGISLVRATVNSPADEAEYRRVFSSIQRDQVDGIVLSDDTENYKHRFLLVQLIQQVRLPALYHLREQVEAGGLMAYSYDLKSALRRQAMQVAEVLRGANPADMPYFQETRFELVINLKTAKELGLEIPAGLVAGAAAVIE